MSLPPDEVNSDLPASHDVQDVMEGEPQHGDPLKTERSTTPPSSPPVYQKTMPSQSQDMPPPTAPASKTCKRSRGEAPEVAINVLDSSANVFDGLDPLYSQNEERETIADSTAANMQNGQNHNHASLLQPSPISAQSAEVTHRQRIIAKPERTHKHSPPQQSQPEPPSEEGAPDSDMTTASNDPGLPEDQLDGYDWNELENRYHDKLAVLQDKEKEHFLELSNLIAFFEIWADVGGRKEDDRGFKRLKTQMAYVQHQEDDLEKKRLHYIRVVDAFKTVGVMLREPNWAQSFVPDHNSLSKVRRSILRRVDPGDNASARSGKRKRDSRTVPLIKVDEWAGRVVEDVDMKRYDCRDRHIARCVIL